MDADTIPDYCRDYPWQVIGTLKQKLLQARLSLKEKDKDIQGLQNLV